LLIIFFTKPDVGSSRKSNSVYPNKAIPKDSFLLFPPLNSFAFLPFYYDNAHFEKIIIFFLFLF